jgi:hypothetical protein
MMKFKLVAIVLLLVLVGACSGRPTDAECEGAWLQLSGVTSTDYDTYEKYVEAFESNAAMHVDLILNKEHSPDSVGHMLKECIQGGWDWRAATGID